jgi:hypothetical protein
MVTGVPPAVGPEVGAIELTVGAATKVNWSLAPVGEVPLGFVTVTSTAPAVWGGDVAVIWVSESTLKPAAGVVPKVTAVAPVKSVPVMTTDVPPAVGPEFGETELTVGSAMNVNWSAGEIAEVPPTVVTVTSTVPAELAGEVAVTSVSESTVKPAAGVVPKVTAAASLKPVPEIVTEVPPAVGPEVGAIELTVGAATKVNWSLAPVGEVPLGVVTVTSTVPAGLAGEVAVI